MNCSKPLEEFGEFLEFVRGGETDLGCIYYGQYIYYRSFAYSTKNFASPELVNRLENAMIGDIIIATTSENVEVACAGKAVAWLGISLKDLAKNKVLAPPLDVQAETVWIFDALTDLEEEVATEFEAERP